MDRPCRRGTRNTRLGTSCSGSAGSCTPRAVPASPPGRPSRERPMPPAWARPAAGESEALQIDQLRDPLAGVRPGAEGEIPWIGALEVEMEIVLPREADAAVELDTVAGHLAVRVGDVRLGHRG